MMLDFAQTLATPPTYRPHKLGSPSTIPQSLRRRSSAEFTRDPLFVEQEQIDAQLDALEFADFAFVADNLE